MNTQHSVSELFSKDISDKDRENLLQAFTLDQVDAKKLTAFVRELEKQRVTSLSLKNAIDVCGTGGSGLPRINTSTIGAFVLSALGVGVAKHGNRAATGRFGSFDFLEALGIDIDAKPELLHYLYYKTNLAFLLAPKFFPVMGEFAEARKKLGQPSAFNLAGPLLNPAATKTQLIGVSYKDCMETVLETAIKIGKENILIVRGEDGLDEVTISGKTDVLEYKNGKKKSYTIAPEDFGLSPVDREAILADTKEEKIQIGLDILKGECANTHRDLVLVNAAVVLHMVGKAKTLKEGYDMALECIISGKAYNQYLLYKKIAQEKTILSEIVGDTYSKLTPPKETGKTHLSNRSFKKALLNTGLSVIAEVKQASPSKGVLAKNFDLVQIAQTYEKNGADAVSVLCNERYFQGRKQHMLKVSQNVNLPILCKDFIITEQQICSARKHGADAVLLMRSVLTCEQIEAFLEVARLLNMDGLVEVHTPEELRDVLSNTTADIIGINNRNLKDLSIDIHHTKKVLQSVSPERLRNVVLVSESGISTPNDIDQLPRNISAVLVGTSLMKHPENLPGIKKARPLVKICGVKNVSTLKACEDTGADMIGLNFVPSSHRCIRLSQVKTLKQSIVRSKLVGVFQNQSLDYVNTIARDLSLDFIQLSGDESVEYVKQCSLPVVKGLSLEDKTSIEKAKKYLPHVAFLLFDSSQPGSGTQPALELLKGVDFPYILAGGLAPNNVREMIQTYKPAGVDVASGVEVNKSKNNKCIQKFISNTCPLEKNPLQKLITESDNGYFGTYGGRYVAETLVPVIDDLRDAYFCYKDDPEFEQDLQDLYTHFSGRKTPLTLCKNLTEKLGGAQIYVKNEGLNHTGAHKINHCLGQILLAKRLGKKRIIAETGAGQHGVATATVCAKMGFECVIYMGKKDYDRQRPNVFSMQQLGAKVIPVTEGGQTLRDAVNAALQDLITRPEDTHYLLGTACGPHPYPAMNAYFQSVIGKEVRAQLQEQAGKMPDCLIACVGGGSNSLGLFTEFLDDPNVEMIGVEAGGKGMFENENTCDHAARMQTGSVGVNEGFKAYLLQNKEGQIKNTHSISAGLDYSGVSPQLSYLKDIGRVQFTYALDDEVLHAYQTMAQTEGILPALESAHAIAEVLKKAPTMSPNQILVVNCSGRGDKDLFIVYPKLDPEGFEAFIQTHQ